MEEIGLSDYIDMLLRRRGIVAAAAMIAVVFGVLFILVTPRTFRGKTTILFPQQQQTSGLMSQRTGRPAIGAASLSGMSGVGMYSQILKSRTLASDVVRELGLEAAGVDAETLLEQVEVDASYEGSLKLSCYALSSWVKTGKITWLDSKYPNEDTKRHTARLAAEITNTYIDALEQYDREHALNSGRNRRVFLESEVNTTREQLTKTEERLRKFIAAHPTVPPPDAASEQVKSIIGMRTLELQAETELREATESIEEAKNVAAGEHVTQSVSRVVTQNPIVSNLKQQITDAEVTRAMLLENFTEKHPDVVAIDQEIEKSREKMREEVSRVTGNETFALNPVRQVVIQNLAGLEIKRSGLEARVQAMNDAMTRVERGISDKAAAQIQYVRLLRDVKALEVVYMSLLADFSNAKVTEAKDPHTFTVLDYAVPEKGPIKPKTKLVLLGSLLLGLMFGSFVAIVNETRRMEKRVRSMGVVSKP